MISRKNIVCKRQFGRRVSAGIQRFLNEIGNLHTNYCCQSVQADSVLVNTLCVMDQQSIHPFISENECSESDLNQQTLHPFISENECSDSDLNIRNIMDEGLAVNTVLSENQFPIVNFANINLKNELAYWASVRHKIAQAYVTDLLHILAPYHKDLPLDCRTLLQTSILNNENRLDNGVYRHFGLNNGLNNLFNKCRIVPFEEKILNLSFNIDGLPLFNSNKFQLWPILCLVKQLSSQPFVVGIFFGNSKPQPITEFLNFFRNELSDLLENGFSFQGHEFQILVHSFVCDAPARAYLKSVKCHGGYSSCDKCEEVGEYHGRVVFLGTKGIRRTDYSFKSKTDEDHHIGDSPMVELNIGMVTTFPIDYMHCVCIGVVKKLLNTWVSGKLSVRLQHYVVTQISEHLSNAKPYIPLEFNRKPRPLTELSFWKATELRTFLLYLGPVILEGCLDISVYEHFLLLHCGITILLSKSHMCNIGIEVAGKFLEIFVSHAKKIYGIEFLVYNVHMLIHLHEDVRLCGPLDDFSCFPFENYLGLLKRLVRSPINPLAQIYRRLSEENNFVKMFSESKPNNTLSFQHNSGPILFFPPTVKQFKKVVHKKITLCTKNHKSSDSFFILSSKKIAQVENIVSTPENKIIIVGREFSVYNNLYEYPIPSGCLGIYIVKKLSDLKWWPLSDINGKCLVIPSQSTSDLICFPLIHSLD